MNDCKCVISSRITPKIKYYKLAFTHLFYTYHKHISVTVNTLHVFNTKLKCFKITDQNSGRQLFYESGTESPRLLSTQSSYVRLRFTSDGIVVESGFLIAYFSKNTNRTHVATYHGDGQCWRCYNALISSNARNYHKMYTVLYVRGYFCDVDESNFIEVYWLIFFYCFRWQHDRKWFYNTSPSRWVTYATWQIMPPLIAIIIHWTYWVNSVLATKVNILMGRKCCTKARPTQSRLRNADMLA